MIKRVSELRRVYAAKRPIESPEFLSVPPRTKEWNESGSGLFLVAESAVQIHSTSSNSNFHHGCNSVKISFKDKGMEIFYILNLSCM